MRRRVLGLFERQEEITANEAAHVLGLSPRQVRDLLNDWVEEGWLVISDAARKTRRVTLTLPKARIVSMPTITLRDCLKTGQNRKSRADLDDGQINPNLPDRC